MGNNDPEQIEDEDVARILNEALNAFINEGNRRAMPRRNQLNVALSTTISEFLNCYKIMGYDLDGNPININVYHNQMEKNALDNMFIDQINEFIAKRR